MSVGNAFFASVLDLVYVVLNLYWYAIMIGAILSWLLAFEVVNPYNRTVRTINDMLARITEPLLAPIRRYLPPAGGFDLSPIVLLFAIYFLQRLIVRMTY
ncbi:MAG: YggT family protein [Alphaproteobacteria bacterium]|nr:YggT family protein [Alphaproteobacteria bacterium]